MQKKIGFVIFQCPLASAIFSTIFPRISFQVSSTLQVPAHSETLLRNNNNISSVTHYHDSSSLEDLNRELETFQLCHSHQFTDDIIHSSRYCDIFSRQSIESGETSSPDLDDEENRIRFVVDIPETGCELIVPKRPTAAIPLNAIYQPCTNVQILKSSCSAFRDISEMKSLQSSSQTEAEDNAATAVIAEEATNKDDEEEEGEVASSLAHTES